MDDLISRQAVLELVADYNLSMGQVVNCIHALPSAQPERKKGEWRKVTKPSMFDAYRCSLCNELVYGKTHFCPNCGADMREGGEQE